MPTPYKYITTPRAQYKHLVVHPANNINIILGRITQIEEGWTAKYLTYNGWLIELGLFKNKRKAARAVMKQWVKEGR